MGRAVDLPPNAEPTSEPAAVPSPAERPDLLIVEAGDSRERRCMDCGRRTATWKPVVRLGVTVILCSDCAAKSAATSAESACPSCGASLAAEDRFCGRCGLRIEYACPTCGAAVDAEDVFCGKCGSRLS